MVRLGRAQQARAGEAGGAAGLATSTRWRGKEPLPNLDTSLAIDSAQSPPGSIVLPVSPLAMSRKRNRTVSGVRIQVTHAQDETATERELPTTTTTASKSVVLRPGKRGRYTQDVSHTDLEESVEGTPDGWGDYGPYTDGDDGLLDTDFGASSLEDTPNPESVQEEVEADTENVKKTVRDTRHCAFGEPYSLYGYRLR